MQTFQEVEAYLNLFYRICSQRNPNGVTNALHQQQSQTGRGLHCAGAQTTRLSNTEVQGLVYLRCDASVSIDRHKDIGSFHTQLEILKVLLVQ